MQSITHKLAQRRTILVPALVGLTIFLLVIGGYLAWTTWLAPDVARPDGPPPVALRLTIRQSGIAAISAEDVRQAGLDADFDALSLSRDGRPVPTYIDGRGRDARLYFYAQAITDTLAAPAVYWLAPGDGQSMDARQAAPSSASPATTGRLTRRWEENSTFLAQARGDDNWLGPFLFAPATEEFPLDGIASNGGPGHLTVRFWADNQAPADPDHHAVVSLNGRRLIDQTWDGISQQTFSADVPDGLLQPDENVLTIALPGDTEAPGEKVYLDWIELAYEARLQSDGQLLFESDGGDVAVAGDDALLFDISQPDAPVYLTGSESDNGRLTFQAEPGRYALVTPDAAGRPDLSAAPAWPAPLTTADRAADFIAILPDAPGFAEAMQPLLDHRASGGMRVAAVSLAQIYDEFGHGRRTPEAIRAFLAHAVAKWEAPAPRFVLLAGDAAYDVNGFSDGKNRDLIPTHLIFTEFAGLVASDTWYVLPDEEPLIPTMAIGRFPAQTAEQLAAMVAKTLAYERADDPASVGRALLVADDEPTFDRASDQLARDLDANGYATQKLYMTQKEAIHDDILAALNAGVGIVNYVGHGGVKVWGDEVVFEADDAYDLSNGDRLPIFTTFTCLNGYFNHPDVDALAETLLWAEDGGIVAAVAPSGRSFTAQQIPLADVFYQQLLDGEAMTLGEALQASKAASAALAGQDEVIHTFNLLGDPALRFQRP